jgi:hypothetical protein
MTVRGGVRDGVPVRSNDAVVDEAKVWERFTTAKAGHPVSSRFKIAKPPTHTSTPPSPRLRLTVIPAKAEALFNSAAGQSSVVVLQSGESIPADMW